MIYFADGREGCGFGHISRGINFCDYLAVKHNLRSCLVIISTSDSTVRLAREKLRAQTVFVVRVDNLLEASKLAYLSQVKIVILDFAQEEIDGQSQLLDSISHIPVTVAIDDLTDRRLLVRANFYPSRASCEDLNFQSSSTKVFSGWDYAILPYYISEISPVKMPEFDLLICFGGEDPFGLTERALQKLDEKPSLRCLVVLGPTFKRSIKVPEGIMVEKSPQNFFQLAANARLVLCSFGASLFEYAYMGLNVQFVRTAPDHEKSSSAFVELGDFEDVTEPFLSNKWEYTMGGDVSEVRRVSPYVSKPNELIWNQIRSMI